MSGYIFLVSFSNFVIILIIWNIQTVETMVTLFLHLHKNNIMVMELVNTDFPMFSISFFDFCFCLFVEISVVRGPALGIPSIRVDGNDILACYYAVKEARKICRQESRPALIEAMTYRLSHHSTSDDSSVYRSDVEVKSWKESSHPLNRIEKLLRRYNVFDEKEEKEWRQKNRKEMIRLMDRLEKLPKFPIKEMFTDVLDQMPKNLHEQYQELMEHLQQYHQHYPQLKNFMESSPTNESIKSN